MITLQRRTFDVPKRKQIVYDIQRYLAEQGTSARMARSRSSRPGNPQELHAEQRLRRRRTAHGRLDRQVEELGPCRAPVAPRAPDQASCAPVAAAAVDGATHLVRVVRFPVQGGLWRSDHRSPAT